MLKTGRDQCLRVGFRRWKNQSKTPERETHAQAVLRMNCNLGQVICDPTRRSYFSQTSDFINEQNKGFAGKGGFDYNAEVFHT